MSSSKFVEKRKHAYKKVFDSFDADGSGQIDKSEVCEAMGIGSYEDNVFISIFGTGKVQNF